MYGRHDLKTSGLSVPAGEPFGRPMIARLKGVRWGRRRARRQAGPRFIYN
jgi:hypothetical protein